MLIREATIADISSIQHIRNAVKENRLSNPALVPDQDVLDYISQHGKGWVCELKDSIAGFAIVSLQYENVWALFVLPEHEKKGVGKALHQCMLDWYFGKGKKTVWLSTSPFTRAEKFYRRAGWQQTGVQPNGEIKFEMTAVTWLQHRHKFRLA